MSPHQPPIEKRFLIASVGVALLILSSSFGAPVVAAWLRAQGLLEIVFAVAFVLCLIALCALGWEAKIGKVEIGLIISVLAVFVFVAVRTNLPEERSHLIEYAVLSALLFKAFRSPKTTMELLKFAAFAALASSIVSVLDELLQIVVPGRVFDIRDLLFNVVASIGGATIVSTLARARLKSD